MNKIKLRQLLKEAFIEDIGDRDITSESIFTEHDVAQGEFLVKADGVASGLDIIREGYHMLNENIAVNLYKNDGDRVKKGDVLGVVEGPVRDLLSGERVILNLLQHMSGIATQTKKAVEKLGSSHTRICDTRKTLPGLRMIEKYAVRCGGGYNHRIGLYDGVMLKDNHIAYAGSIANAVAKARSQLGHMVKIEVEIETKDELLEAIESGADIIMFDNCSPETAKEFQELVPEHITTEISGGITLETIHLYRETNVDYISLGALTHSVKALDISFNLKNSAKAQ